MVPNGRVVTALKYEFKAVEGKRRGLFLTEDAKAGDTILLEEPVVIGPKQMSQLVRSGNTERQYSMTFWIKKMFWYRRFVWSASWSCRLWTSACSAPDAV